MTTVWYQGQSYTGHEMAIRHQINRHYGGLAVKKADLRDNNYQLDDEEFAAARMVLTAVEKRDGFGIGELGRTPEMTVDEKAAEIAHHEANLKRARRSECHYCGMPATRVDFFGAPVCDECR